MPGAVLGAHVAGLIFFLNPEIPLSWGRGLRAVGLYSLLLGAAGAALQAPWLVRRPERAFRWLPWTMSLALALGASMDAAHASIYAYYLPAGINVRLLKGALWLALGTLISFYTALLHTLERRRYGPRSRWAIGLVAALSLVAVGERREAFVASRELPARRPVPARKETTRLRIVGLDGASLDAILPLAGQGRLPAFGALLREGSYGRLETLDPTRRPAVWTSLATGKYPFRHGVTGEVRYEGGLLGESFALLPRGLAIRSWGLFGARPSPRPPTRKALTLWEILELLGLPASAISWPSSWPPAGADSQVVSETFFRSGGAVGEVRPADFGRRVVSSRVQALDLDAATLATLGATPRKGLREALAGDLWREAVCFGLGPEVERMVVVLPGLAEASRADFGGFYAAQFEGSANVAAEEASRRIASYYERLDRFLGELLAREPSSLVAVLSANGAGPVGWKERIQGSPAFAGTLAGGQDGILLLRGPGIRAGALLTGARIVDVVPTLLYGLGLPVARDLDGRVLTTAFESSFLAARPMSFFPSYQALEGAPAGGVRPDR